MIPVPAELAAAIEAPHRQPSIELSVDWDSDGHSGPGTLDDLSPMVTGYRLDRTLTGDLPDQVRLVSGAGSASARLTLARGPGALPAAGYFSPLHSDSPLAGKQRVGAPATVDVAFATPAGPRTVRRLTGRTRTLAVGARTGDATLSLLDHRERLRGLVALPPIEAARYGCNATWIIGWALAVCGWTVGPMPRNMRRTGAVAEAGWTSDTAVCAPMHGSLWPWFRGLSYAGGLSPEIGCHLADGGPEQPVQPRFVPGPYVLGAYAAAQSNVRYEVIRAALNPSGPEIFEHPARTGRIECWLRGDPYPTTGGPEPHVFRVQVRPLFGTSLFEAGVGADRRLYARLFNGSTDTFRVFGPTLPTDGAWHFAGVAFRLAGATPVVAFRLDGTETSTPVTASGAAGLADVYHLTSYLPIAELHLTATPVNTPWLHQSVGDVDAVVDPSTLELDAVYERDLREAWTLLREIAAAEHAAVLCDEPGLLHYRTRARLLQPGPAQIVLTDTNAITELAVTETVDTVRNVVEVPFTTPVVDADWVWTLDTPFPIGAGQAKLGTPIVLDHAVTELDQTVDLLDQPPTGPPTSYLRANTAPDGTGTPITSGVSADPAGFATSGQGRIDWRNFTTQTVYVTEARLAGRAIRTRPVGVARAEYPDLATSDRQPEPLRLPASQWVQRADIAANLAAAILPDLAQPRPVITDLAIRADPRLQLGDRIRLVDRYRLGVDHDWWITGITETYSPDGGYAMRITARQAS